MTADMRSDMISVIPSELTPDMISVAIAALFRTMSVRWCPTSLKSSGHDMQCIGYSSYNTMHTTQCI
jgi:hypothetical protein